MEVAWVDAAGDTWVREGSCNGCGECCADGGDPSINNPLFTDAERAGQTSPGHCPLLRLTADGSVCAGHEQHQYYWSGCHSFPARPEDIESYPGCGYRFVRR